MTVWLCLACEHVIDTKISEDLGVCRNCMDNNRDVFDFTKNPDQFKKEFSRLYYADTFEHWYVNVKELEFFERRWGLRSIIIANNGSES